MEYLPKTSQELGAWFLALSIVYVVAKLVKMRNASTPLGVATAFDATTFAISVMLLVGVVHHPTLVAIGDTTIFFVITGLAGLIYAVEAL